MDITLYRYLLSGATWDQTFNDNDFIALVNILNTTPFQGDDEERKYGFVQCLQYEASIYGLFIQKYPEKLMDYDDNTKEQMVSESINSEEYLFIFTPNKLDLYLQARRNKDLPSRTVIKTRFEEMLKFHLSEIKKGFDDLVKAKDEYDREEALRIFYEISDTVLELDLSEFDEELVNHEYKRRGKFQTYWNPKDEYQEAGHDAAVKFAKNASRSSIKAKRDQSLKKDPVTRIMLEGSRKPQRIVYTKENETITKDLVHRSKERLYLEDDKYDLEAQVESISHQLKGIIKKIKTIKNKNSEEEEQDIMF